MPIPISVHRDRDIQALELRKAGATYTQIARQLAMANKSVAHKAVMRALNETLQPLREAAQEVRELELARLDQMLLGLWESARKGNHGSIDRVIRIMERRSAYLGLDAPKQHEVTGADGGPIEVDARLTLSEQEVDSFVLAIIERAGARVDRLSQGQQPALAPPNGTTNGSVAH